MNDAEPNGSQWGRETRLGPRVTIPLRDVRPLDLPTPLLDREKVKRRTRTIDGYQLDEPISRLFFDLFFSLDPSLGKILQLGAARFEPTES